MDTIHNPITGRETIATEVMIALFKNNHSLHQEKIAELEEILKSGSDPEGRLRKHFDALSPDERSDVVKAYEDRMWSNRWHQACGPDSDKIVKRLMEAPIPPIWDNMESAG
jgi:hypothetical protein